MSFLFRVFAVLAFLFLIRYAFQQGMTHALQRQDAGDSAAPRGVGVTISTDGCSIGDPSPRCNAKTGQFDGTVPSQ